AGAGGRGRTPVSSASNESVLAPAPQPSPGPPRVKRRQAALRSEPPDGWAPGGPGSAARRPQRFGFNVPAHGGEPSDWREIPVSTSPVTSSRISTRAARSE